jgi:hypothetical protein
MESTALILIIVTLFLLVIILGLLTALVYKLMKNPPKEQKMDPAPTDYHPSIRERMLDLEKLKPKRNDLFCPNHPEEPGEVMCAICDKLYCKACIKPFKTLHFCKEHLPLIMRHDWDEIFTLKTSTHDPEQGVRLYEIKKELFQKEDIPTYIETHYKINVDQDFIETYLVLFGIKENISSLKEKLKDFVISE